MTLNSALPPSTRAPAPGDMDDLGLLGGAANGMGGGGRGANALAELLQAGADWGAPGGRRNRTFRYRLAAGDGGAAAGAGGLMGGAGGAAGGEGGALDPAHLLSLATTLMPTQHRLLMGRGAAPAPGSSAAAAAALAAGNVLPLTAAQGAAGTAGAAAAAAAVMPQMLLQMQGGEIPSAQMLAAIQVGSREARRAGGDAAPGALAPCLQRCLLFRPFQSTYFTW